MLRWPELYECESISIHRVSNEKNSAKNMITSVMMWSTWELRNDTYFGWETWSDLQVMWPKR